MLKGWWTKEQQQPHYTGSSYRIGRKQLFMFQATAHGDYERVAWKNLINERKKPKKYEKEKS